MKGAPSDTIKQQQTERAKYRCFPVQVLAGRAVGVVLRKTTFGAIAGAEMRELTPLGSGAFVREWILRCAQTFPDDAIKIGDDIVRANWALSPDGMLEVLSAQGEPRLLILARWTGASATGAKASSEEAHGVGEPPGGAAAEPPAPPRSQCSGVPGGTRCARRRHNCLVHEIHP